MAEKLTLEQAVKNVAEAKEQFDKSRKHRNELSEHLAEATHELYATEDALESAKQALLQIALQTKGDK